jgi:hypothetical protein
MVNIYARMQFIFAKKLVHLESAKLLVVCLINIIRSMIAEDIISVRRNATMGIRQDVLKIQGIQITIDVISRFIDAIINVRSQCV